MKTNSRIFAFLLMTLLMAMGFPQDLKRLSYLAYLDQDKSSWKSNVAIATKAYQAKPDAQSKFQLALMEYGLLNATMKDQDEKLFDAYVDGLEDRLEELSKDKTYGAEAKALLSSVLGFKIAYTPLGITLALTFVTLPFVVRTLQPVLADIPREVEEAAACLGAKPLQVFRYILVPALLPAWLTGFALAFARGVGEYGSVIFIAGNMPMKTEILPLLIMVKLDQYDYTGATAIGVLMLVVSFILLLSINLLQRRIAHG